MTDTGSRLPAAVEQLWGLREPTRRGGPKPALSLDRIVAAAVGLADEGGLAALSMSRLAEKLGFTTMSVYRYVASKDDLLVLALDAAIGQPPEIDPAGAWRDQLVAWAQELQVRYRAHPWMTDVPISGLIEARRDDLSDAPRDCLAHLFGTFVDEEDQQRRVRMIDRDG